jgi:hypothetical protein
MELINPMDILNVLYDYIRITEDEGKMAIFLRLCRQSSPPIAEWQREKQMFRNIASTQEKLSMTPKELPHEIEHHPQFHMDLAALSKCPVPGCDDHLMKSKIKPEWVCSCGYRITNSQFDHLEDFLIHQWLTGKRP